MGLHRVYRGHFVTNKWLLYIGQTRPRLFGGSSLHAPPLCFPSGLLQSRRRHKTDGAATAFVGSSSCMDRLYQQQEIHIQ